MAKTTRKTPLPGRPQLTVAEQRGLISSRASRYSIQDIFKYGYRNKEDVSNLPANVLVVGSQNVVTNASELVGIRQGYVLDGIPSDLEPTAPAFPTSAATVPFTWSRPWTNPENIEADDGSYAVNHGFADYFIPFDYQVSIVKSDGSIGTLNQAQSTPWTSSDTIATYGGSKDLWGETWTPDDINNANFGAVLSVKMPGHIPTPTSEFSDYLKGTGFGFSIPSGSVISGIELSIQRKYSGTFYDVQVDYFQMTVYYFTQGVNPGIDSAYDFQSRLGTIRNLRKWGENLEVRYVDPSTGIVSWVNILATLIAANVVNFTPFWDQNGELKKFCLFVNGDNNVYEWSGGVGSYLSSTPGVAGSLATVAPASGSYSGYTQGDILAVSGGTGGTIKILAVASGVPTSIAIQNPGSGYTAGSAVATTGGTGTGFVIDTTVQTAGSLTLSGTQTTSQLGFYDNGMNTSNFKLLDENGNTYTYTSVSGETFQGVFPDPTGAFVTGDPVVQKPRSITGDTIATTGGGHLGTAFIFNLIATLENQIWYGDSTQNNVYVSRTNNYKSVEYSVPARLPAEGALIVLDGPPVGFTPQAGQMYITAGTDQWWISQKLDQTIDVSAVATPTQTLYASRLKTAFNQAAKSQALIAQYKNSLVYVSNEPIINALGQVQNINNDPQVVNMSDPIKFDVDAYDFSGGQVFYDNYYIYVTVPANGVVRMYNVQKNYWEAPQTLPVSRFYHVLNAQGQTELYGHSSITNESYQLFVGYNDNGNPINAIAAFPYVCQQGGSADMRKSFNQVYTEGYISANTQVLLELNYDFGGFSGTYGTVIDGTDTNILFNRVTDGSLGRNTLGSQPIGTILNLPFAPVVPKFRSIKTMPRQDFFEYQIVYSTNQVDAQWTLLRFGPAVEGAQALPTKITE